MKILNTCLIILTLVFCFLVYHTVVKRTSDKKPLHHILFAHSAEDDEEEEAFLNQDLPDPLTARNWLLDMEEWKFINSTDEEETDE